MKSFERVLLLAVALGVLVFDVWTVRSSGDRWNFGKKQNDYYNLLIAGWLDGQLALKADVPAALLNLPDPYDPAQRPAGLALHDASLYRGKYYLYFGVAPVVVLMLPFRLLTGLDLPLPAAEIVFVYGAFLASAAAWLRLRRKYFPDAGVTVSALCVLALGFASLGPVLLRRPQMWELPIGAGYCFAMLTLLAVFESLHSARRRAAWFAAAGLLLGLAIASRPTYLVATPLLLAPLGWWWREQRRVPGCKALAVVLPLAAIGGLMALHNFLRFDNPLQFGQAYQLSLDYESKMPHFRAGYAAFNTRRYFFSVARWSAYFPFISPAALPEKPAGFGGHDDVYGVLTNLPLAWLAFAAPFAAWRRAREERGRLFAWLGAAAIMFFTMAGVLLCYFGSLARYELDFAPALMLLACVGVLVCERAAKDLSRLPRATVRAVWGGAALGSAAFAVLFSLQLNRLLAERNPAGYRAVAQALNHVPAVIEQITGVRPGAWEIEVWLPRTAHERTETLISVGDPPAVDRIFVRTVDLSHVQLGLARMAMPDVVSRPLAFDSSRPHRVRLTLGAFLPPDTHPWFAGVPADEARRASRLLRLEVDGKIVVQTFRRFEAVAGGRVRVGAKSLGDAAHPRFSGELISARQVPLKRAAVLVPPTPDELSGAGDRFALTLKFPRDRADVCEPLIVSGSTGQGDLLGVEYLGGEHMRFVFDHWGSALLRSAPVRIDPVIAHAVVVRLPWLAAVSGRVEQRGELQVTVDGAVVWRQATMGYLADPEEIAVGANPIGGSTCGAAFTGEVLAARRGRE